MRKSSIAFIIAGILFVAGIAFLLVDPIKNYQREKKMDEAIVAAESFVSNIEVNQDNSQEETIPPTFVVSRDEGEIEGEIDDEISRAQMEEAINNLPEYVTLTYFGILRIDSIELTMPVWESSDVIALRYGGGHYELSSRPGEGSNCTILGHHMRDYGLMFNRLGEVTEGDIITLTTMDSTEYRYRVYATEIVSPEDLLNKISSSASDSERLTLVTCTYTGAGTMRLLVYAELEETN